MKQIKTLTVGGETYRITDPDAARIDDESAGEATTWSGARIQQQLGAVETALDNILAMQNELIGGDGA